MGANLPGLASEDASARWLRVPSLGAGGGSDRGKMARFSVYCLCFKGKVGTLRSAGCNLN